MKNEFRAIGLTAVIVFALAAGMSLAAEKSDKKKDTKADAKPQTQLVTEGEFSKWLVQVLGLSRFVSVAPTEAECFAVLLQNAVSPKAGWNGTNVVSRATLARVVVQALGLQSEVKNPENDASWIDYLKEKDLDISTIGAAVENLDILDSALANEAVIVSTDPLGKIHKIRPEDEQQLGADLSTIRRLMIFIEEQSPTPTPTPAPKKQQPAEDPPDVTPNFALLF